MRLFDALVRRRDYDVGVYKTRKQVYNLDGDDFTNTFTPMSSPAGDGQVWPGMWHGKIPTPKDKSVEYLLYHITGAEGTVRKASATILYTGHVTVSKHLFIAKGHFHVTMYYGLHRPGTNTPPYYEHQCGIQYVPTDSGYQAAKNNHKTPCVPSLAGPIEIMGDAFVAYLISVKSTMDPPSRRASIYRPPDASEASRAPSRRTSPTRSSPTRSSPTPPPPPVLPRATPSRGPVLDAIYARVAASRQTGSGAKGRVKRTASARAARPAARRRAAPPGR